MDVGFEVPGYRLTAPLGEGGMADVYAVEHRATGERAALKVLKPGCVYPSAVGRFRREIEVLEALDSPHVLDVLDRGEIDGRPFFVTPLLEGADLGTWVRREGPLPPPRVVECLRQVAQGLERAHAQGVVHRDLKPSNLFLSNDGTVTILDFGIARVDDGLAPKTQAILGTPMYLAPEQVRHRRVVVGPAADIYALGQVAYALLVGEAYWRADDEAVDTELELMMEAAFGLPEAATERARRRRGVELPPAFDGWFATAAAIEPEARFASATEAVEALAEALDGRSPVASPSAPGRRFAPFGSVALVAAVATGAAAWAWGGPGADDRSRVEAPAAVPEPRPAPTPSAEALAEAREAASAAPAPAPPAPSASASPRSAVVRPPPPAPPPSPPRAWKPPITHR